MVPVDEREAIKQLRVVFEKVNAFPLKHMCLILLRPSSGYICNC
jgi:hypothetical protein